ncbi:DNA sulfur modification protein DndB [Metabacillus idriensis]|uniref:DNA sulfur modification protein DndB n=1 Tax=Metabacillus idriensis TaxID=324768 RepID=UPI00174EBF55|nr:DNA sulfur modification protein DndB [Metabacillus idriensis]
MFNIKLNGLINLINGQSKAVMTTQISVRDVLNVYKIDNSVNRDINYSRLNPLSKYIDSYDTEIGIFLPSLVFAFPEDPSTCYDKQKKELNIPVNVKLKVIDGQHRIKGLEHLLKNISESERKNRLLDSTLTAQIYFGLKDEDEKNVFVDINSNAKRVSMSLITKYDTREIMRVLVRDLYNTCTILETIGVEFNKSRIVKPNSTMFFTSARLKSFINALLFGKAKTSKKDEEIIKNRYDDILIFLDKFFIVLFEALPSVPGDVKKYTLGHEALQMAIALYLHEEIIIETEKDMIWINNWEPIIDKLSNFDWSARNSLFNAHMIISRPNTDKAFKAFVDNKPHALIDILKSELI